MISSYAYAGMGSAGTQVATSVGSGAMAVGSSLMTAGIATGPAAPIVIAVGALIDIGAAIASALHIGEGCGQTCVQATSVVNSAEPTFQANLTGYEQGVIDQTTALNNFNGMWLAIQQSCGAIPGAAGQNCVGDRQQGACKWKQTANPQYPGQPAMGQCWNWWNAYHDPLTLPSQVPFGGGTSTTTTGTTGVTNTSVSPAPTTPSFNLSMPLILGAGLILVGVVMS